jgi:hypothetical protein
MTKTCRREIPLFHPSVFCCCQDFRWIRSTIYPLVRLTNEHWTPEDLWDIYQLDLVENPFFPTNSLLHIFGKNPEHHYVLFLHPYDDNEIKRWHVSYIMEKYRQLGYDIISPVYVLWHDPDIIQIELSTE